MAGPFLILWVLKRHERMSDGHSSSRESDQDQRHHNAAHERDERIRKRIGEALILTIYVVFDFRDEWPKNHVSALILGVIAVSSILLIELPWKKWAMTTAALVISAAIVWSVAPPVLPGETVNSGLLIPADDATPKTACTPNTPKNDATGAGWFFVTIAGGGVFTVTPTDRLIAISVDGRPTVVIERSEKGILLDVDMFNPDGTLAVRIEKNAWTASTAQTFKATKIDTSTLSVVGVHGEELLWVRYMNANTVKINGTFYKIGDPQPVVITDSAISLGHMQLYMAPMMTPVPFVPCFIVGTADFRDPIFTFK
jgi:hypothetical protein